MKIKKQSVVNSIKITNESFDDNEKQLKLLTDENIDALGKMNISVLANSVEVFDPNEPWIQTYSGKRFTPLKPNVESICIEDIAHSLSMLCRFSGHSLQFYSVAQHSVGVSYLCDNKYALQGLLHDATESFMNDLPAPIKASGKLDEYIKIEKNLQKMIFKKFGTEENEHESVKRADFVMLATEARDLMNQRPDWVNIYNPIPFKIVALNPKEAKELFMKRFYDLTK